MSEDALVVGSAEESPREKQPRRTSSFADGIFVFDQEIEQKRWQLRYDYGKCNGCGLCVEICPTRCMELGNVPEIASGLDAPAIMIDGENCCFCGMCAGLCPLRALEFSIDGEDYREQDGRYPYLAGGVDVKDDCLPCLICAEGCPTDSIKLDLKMPSKEDLVPFNESAKGDISIDQDKCTLCGLCVRFCGAIELLEAEPKGNEQMPFGGIIVNEDGCDYCGLCVPLCPDDAITVNGDIVEKEVKWSGEITLNDGTCIRCGRCQEICPYDAIEVEKFLEGRIDIVKYLLTKCDPTGCVACFAACPTDAWYVPEDGVIAVNEDVCNYCGGCQQACRYLIIEVHRDGIRTTPIEDASWHSQWERAIAAIIGGERGLLPLPRITAASEEAPPVRKETIPKIPKVPKNVKKQIDKNFKNIREVLGYTKVRYLMERDGSKAVDELVSRIGKDRKGGKIVKKHKKSGKKSSGK
jgi:4Fe-4S ferredoxin